MSGVLVQNRVPIKLALLPTMALVVRVLRLEELMDMDAERNGRYAIPSAKQVPAREETGVTLYMSMQQIGTLVAITVLELGVKLLRKDAWPRRSGPIGTSQRV